MKLKKIGLKNFRNSAHSEINFSDGINFIIGKNGEGKTSFLEAISIVTTLRSFKTKNLNELITYEKDFLEINAETETAGLSHKNKIIFSKKDKRIQKEIYLNEKLMKTSTQYLNTRFGSIESAFHSICFNPSDHDLVNGDPLGRRYFMDRAISAESKSYFESLHRFKKALESRNTILKLNFNKQALDAFTSVFIEEGAKITDFRLNWIKTLNLSLNQYSKKIAKNTLNLEIQILTKWIIPSPLEMDYFTLQDPLERLKFLKNSLSKKLLETKNLEREAKTTLVGPQRDDWFFQFGNHSLKIGGSQGEVRTALLALKLSELEMYRKNTKGEPLFLLDDFSSELDEERRNALIQYLSETPLQVFITSTEVPTDLKIQSIFKVENGSIKKNF